jgi:hypothetical protein
MKNKEEFDKKWENIAGSYDKVDHNGNNYLSDGFRKYQRKYAQAKIQIDSRAEILLQEFG